MKSFIVVYALLMTAAFTYVLKHMNYDHHHPSRNYTNAYVIKYAADSVYIFNGDGQFEEDIIGSYKWELGEHKADSLINAFENQNR